jgi:hypothetical protein
MNSRETAKNPLETWPELPLHEWQDTYATLHMWTQIVGKIKLAQCPHVNHWWQVVLYLSARGLTTSPIPYGSGTFEIEFDFIDHQLILQTNGGGQRSFAFSGNAVALFYRKLMDALDSLGIKVKIWTVPVEVEERIPFEQDTQHASYDPDYARRCWQIMAQTDTVLKQFRSRYIGKCSPVHFFWGAFDMAVTRFSGRRAPEHPGGVPALADFVAREAYSHEVSSCGFWPGGGIIQEPCFYAYQYPEAEGFQQATVYPEGAFYSADLNEFLLPYNVVRTSENPDEVLLEFLQSTYEAAANLGNWDRSELERRMYNL